MTITQAQLDKRVKYWQSELAELGIQHWRIDDVQIVDETPSGSTANATVGTSSYYDNATFWFQAQFLSETTKRELDETIIHEWVHVAFRDFDQILNCVSDWMPPKTYKDFDADVSREREGVVERLARVLYGFHL